MTIKQKENLDSTVKEQLKNYVFDIVGVIHDVYKELPNGLPEYIYQEALDVALAQADISHKKEFKYHPVFRGQPLESHLRMDFMIPRERGNIILECKAIEKITATEYQQLFSYLIGTGFPIGILVNFHDYPRAQIQRFYFDRKDNTITAF